MDHLLSILWGGGASLRVDDKMVGVRVDAMCTQCQSQIKLFSQYSLF